MTEDAINTVVNKYISEHLSPKPEHRTYISEKYTAICEVLGGSCFQVGSYARYTAIYPVHDLDIIYVVNDPSIKENPLRFMQALCERLKKSGIKGVKDVFVQSHSITVVFDDSGEETGFTIDVVPALELSERNRPYGEPMYEVPEILKLNKHNRQRRYGNEATQPIKWVKTDPRGYIRDASDLNKANLNFRHAAKFGKGWRHECKVIYEDDFRLKSFHFEQMFYWYFIGNPRATTVEAIIYCFGAIQQAIQEPQFKDRADDTVFIDEYVRSLTPREKQLIVKLQASAYAAVLKLPGAQNEAELRALLEVVFDIERPAPAAATMTVVSQSRQPWAC